MATDWQNPPDADVILRASGGKELHAHKLVLSLASPVFKDMFSVPQLPDESSQTPVIDVGDPPGTLEIFLQIIYPVPYPLIDDVETLASLLHLADKYDVKAVLDVHKHYLTPVCINPPPIHAYAIFCACGREKEAEAAARRVSFASLASLSSPLLHLMTIDHYQRLVKFMVARDQKMREIAGKHQTDIANSRSFSCGSDVHRLYSGTIVATIQAAFEADPCVGVVEALGLVSGAASTFPLCSLKCKYGVCGLQKYAEGLLKELVEMVESLQWTS